MKNRLKISALVEYGYGKNMDLSGLDPEGEVIRKSSPITIEQDEERTFVADITSSALDRDDEIVWPAGLDIDRYMGLGKYAGRGNPVVYINHNYSELPSGQTLAMERVGSVWRAKMKLASGVARIDDAWILIRQKVVRGNSIGFYVRESVRPETKEWGAWLATTGFVPPEGCRRIFTSTELVENSICGLPSNPDALVSDISAKAAAVQPPAKAAELEGEPFDPCLVTLPYANEHSARLRDPDGYARFRRQNDKFGSGIHAIFGIKADGAVELQAIRFSADKFTPAEARKWLADHDYHPISFEEASGPKAAPIVILRMGPAAPRLTPEDAMSIVRAARRGRIV